MLPIVGQGQRSPSGISYRHPAIFGDPRVYPLARLTPVNTRMTSPPLSNHPVQWRAAGSYAFARTKVEGEDAGRSMIDLWPRAIMVPTPLPLGSQTLCICFEVLTYRRVSHVVQRWISRDALCNLTAIPVNSFDLGSLFVLPSKLPHVPVQTLATAQISSPRFSAQFTGIAGGTGYKVWIGRNFLVYLILPTPCSELAPGNS